MRIDAYRTAYREEDADYDTMEVDVQLDNGNIHYAAIRVYGEAIEPVRNFLQAMGVKELEA